MKKYALIVLLITSTIFAQRSNPWKAVASKINEKITIDGNLNEPAWIKGVKISNFTEQEPVEGAKPTEKTEVTFLYDSNNLYVGVWCWDSEPDKISAKKMNRDSRWWTDDNFEIIFSPFNDKRNGYLFVTNPNGMITDVLISDGGKSTNINWNGIWDVATTITNKGWFAEFVFPFSTFKFPNSKEQVWGLNMERNIRRKLEQVVWQGWSRNTELEQISNGGELIGIKNISSDKFMELYPFASGGLQKTTGEKWINKGKAGLDASIILTPTMKLNLTANTDFSQVESDQHRINLSRFSLFYPEKRKFFLEGKNVFEVNMTGGTRIFHSRRIGIKDGEEIPIYGGARLLGKTGNTHLGVLTMQTASKDMVPSTNYSVMRVKQDVLDRSYVGAIFTGMNNADMSNYVYGIDGNYATSKFLGNNNLNINGVFSQSFTKGETNKDNSSYTLFVDFPNDLIDWSARVLSVAESYNPEIGYVRRKNIVMYSGHFVYSPRPGKWGIRRLEFKPLDFDYYETKTTHEMESLNMEFRPLGFITESGEGFEFNIIRSFDRIDEAYAVFGDNEINPGKYWMTRYEIQAHSYWGNPFFVRANFIWGQFYSGSGYSPNLYGSWSISRHLAVNIGWHRNFIELNGIDFTTDEISGSASYSFNPKLFTNIYAQWNNEENQIILNYRVNWIPKIGSNFYFVINQTVETEGGKLHNTDLAILGKFVWLFTF